MKNILRIITVLLIVTVLFTSLTACKSKKDTEASSEPVISETVSDEPKADDTSSSDETTSTKDESPVSSVPDTSSKAPTTSTPSKIETPTQSEPAKQPEPQPAVKTAQELLIGKWSCSYDCSDQLAEMGYADLGGCIVSATVEFTSGGSYVASVNMQNLLQTMRPALEQSITESLASEGKTEDDFYAEIGMTVPEYIDSLLSIYSSGINAVSSYKFEGNTLYIKDTASEEFYETPYNFINDDTLTLNEGGEDLLYTRIK